MLPKGANLQKIRDGKRTFAITPGISGGFIKPEQLRRYADTAEKYGATLKLTSAQRIMITGLKAEDVDAVWEDLGVKPVEAFANCVRSVKMCPGSAFCKRGLQDSVKLGMELEKRYHKKEMPSRLKIGVAGCPNSCAEVHIKDIGVFATESGWTVLAGGSCGRNPRLAERLAEDLGYDDVLTLVECIIEYYQENADIERIGELIARIGFDRFREDIVTAFAKKRDVSRLTINEDRGAGTFQPETEVEDIKIQGENEMKITKESIIGQVIRQYPDTIAIFRSHGMGCLGCPSASAENIEKAAGIHGIDLEALLKDLNEAV